jgi:hypothetical protein
MSIGEMLYLLLAIGGATMFAVVLAFYSHQTSLARRDQIVRPALARTRENIHA